jgi:hypothetical protein
LTETLFERFGNLNENFHLLFFFSSFCLELPASDGAAVAADLADRVSEVALGEVGRVVDPEETGTLALLVCPSPYSPSLAAVPFPLLFCLVSSLSRSRSLWLFLFTNLFGVLGRAESTWLALVPAVKPVPAEVALDGALEESA